MPVDTPFEMAFTQNANDGVAVSPTPSPEPSSSPPTDQMMTIVRHLQSLSDTFNTRFTKVEAELRHLAHKVDTPAPTAPHTISLLTPMFKPHPSPPALAATRPPPAAPDALPNATRPTQMIPDASAPAPTTRLVNREPDAPP